MPNAMPNDHLARPRFVAPPAHDFEVDDREATIDTPRPSVGRRRRVPLPAAPEPPGPGHIPGSVLYEPVGFFLAGMGWAWLIGLAPDPLLRWTTPPVTVGVLTVTSTLLTLMLQRFATIVWRRRERQGRHSSS